MRERSTRVTVSDMMPMISTIDAVAGVSSYALPTASAWPSNGLAIYVPHRIVAPTWVRRVWYVSGNSTGNVDVGVYNAAGTRLVSSGATAQAGTNTCFFIDVTPTLLMPGDHWLAISYASTTATPFRVAPTGLTRTQGICQEASAHPLPATMTPVAAGQELIPFFGFSTLAADL